MGLWADAGWLWHAYGELYGTAVRVYPRSTTKWFIKRGKFISRSLYSLPVWSGWHRYLTASPFAALIQAHPRVLEKPLRPYLHKRLSRAERSRILRDHYTFMSRHAPDALIQALFQDRAFAVLDTSLSGLAEPLCVCLTYSAHMQQEGELTLTLQTRDEGRRIASVTFVVQRGDSGLQLMVGGMQGGRPGEGRASAKLATKALYGMRPKFFLLHILRELATAWGIAEIYAISDRAHVLQRLRYRYRSVIRTSYDEVWTEAGGVPNADGYFRLPAAVTRRALETVASHKRAQYQRRFRMLDDCAVELTQRLRR
jgi:uncharacterized protein VirK/YbjX